MSERPPSRAELKRSYPSFNEVRLGRESRVVFEAEQFVRGYLEMLCLTHPESGIRPHGQPSQTERELLLLAAEDLEAPQAVPPPKAEAA